MTNTLYTIGPLIKVSERGKTDNLLACPRDHVESVFEMLRRQDRQVEFTGGLEARALADYQVELLASLRPRPNMFFAYDPGDDFETLESAARRLLEAGFTRESHKMRCYVLIGFPKDTFALAEARLQQMLSIGFTPHAMLWRPETQSQMKYAPEESWRTFQRRWARPAIIHARETVPYGCSMADRARVKAARAAQRDDAADLRNLRPAHRPKKAESVDNGARVVHASERPSGNAPIFMPACAGELTPYAGMVEAGFRKMLPRRKSRRGRVRQDKRALRVSRQRHCRRPKAADRCVRTEWTDEYSRPHLPARYRSLQERQRGRADTRGHLPKSIE
jgi:hypothetical protein